MGSLDLFEELWMLPVSAVAALTVQAGVPCRQAGVSYAASYLSGERVAIIDQREGLLKSLLETKQPLGEM